MFGDKFTKVPIYEMLKQMDSSVQRVIDLDGNAETGGLTHVLITTDYQAAMLFQHLQLVRILQTRGSCDVHY